MKVHSHHARSWRECELRFITIHEIGAVFHSFLHSVYPHDLFSWPKSNLLKALPLPFSCASEYLMYKVYLFMRNMHTNVLICQYVVYPLR